MDDHFPAQGRYEQMLASSATAAICAGPDGFIVSWNTAAEQLFGHSAQQVVGKPISIIIPTRHRAAHDAGLARAVRAGHSRLAGHAVEMLALHADGQELPVDLSLSMWFEGGKPMFGALLRDITDRQTAQRRLEHLAHCDTLTSLPNRNALRAQLAVEIEKSPCSLLLLDLDGFKHVNDTLGHSVGDALLAAVAARLTSAAGTEGFVARLGGDEFAILIANCNDPLKIDEVATSIFDGLEAPFELAGQFIFVGTSIGIAIAPKDATGVEQLLSSADLALYSAKSNGGGVRAFFARAMQNSSEQKHRLGTELRQALANAEFELWYQPQVALPSRALLGVEALLRWRHPDHGLLPPQTFIEVLAESTIAEEVGDWIIEQACVAAAAWGRTGLGPLRVGVNMFPAQLRSDRLFTVVSSALTRNGLDPQQLEIEITENTVLRHSKQATKALKKLKALGVGIAFDDFGTGFASLSLLQKFPLTRLKIDRSFVARIDRKAGDAAIVEAVVGMARGLGLAVIAEGVETAAQEAALMTLGCQEAQGYLYGRPMPAATFTQTYLNGSFSPKKLFEEGS
ncbi:putative bifunctional diguanylate cyclase/phosphodiesterase [Sphingomonas radiodurans]|uniref:putative bifunctional diguanylate cyclase/phosphodiesterase n=1 Tax=Sphingomonas radiodurans TaxID=2890321 RepID=UPI001E64CCF0|nr:EAL domain-containing protein [Sphingomonas radiodurans]WBH15846.1 EAL domain-containing protein [Sphingomonas radiodurans]